MRKLKNADKARAQDRAKASARERIWHKLARGQEHKLEHWFEREQGTDLEHELGLKL